MAKKVFHSSIEGAQHNPKGLVGFLEMAQDAGASGAQPSNFMLDGFNIGQIKDIFSQFSEVGLPIDGVSGHCPFWVQTTAWTGSPTIRPFLPEDIRSASVDKIEEWAEVYIMEMLDLCSELGIKIVPMFWGVVYGWEVATGYPWGFFSGPEYDLIKEGTDRFITKTQKIRDHANSLGIILAHEIHPGTGATCADDFLYLLKACDGDPCIRVNADPSHCWDGEDWVTRFEKVGPYVFGCHVKNHYITDGLPLHSMEPTWSKRAMQFTDLSTGDINLTRFTELMIKIGYNTRYCQLMGTNTAPLVVEAESAYRNGDETSIKGIEYVRDHLCFTVAESSFEDAMGVEK